jgi:hypothetical protein
MGEATQVREGSVADLDDGDATDEIYEVLSNHRRRYALHYLKQNGRNAELGTVSERVAAWENEIGLEEVSSDQRKRVYTSLQRYHFPKMDEAELLEFDRREGTVELTERADDLDLYMEVINAYDVPWSLYYVGLAAIGGVMLLADLFGLPPFDAVPGTGWAVFLVTSLLVSALAHTVLTRRMRLGSDDAPPEVQ